MKVGLLILSVVIFTGCKSQDNDVCKNAVCTMIFASVSVNIFDSANVTLKGITTKTLLESNNKEIHVQSGSFQSGSSGTFNIVDDSHLKVLGYNKETKVLFQILKDGNVIQTYPFTIQTDCCHVSKKSGVDNVFLN